MATNRWITLALTAALLLYAILGLFMRYEADDYCMAADAHLLGILGAAQNQYLTWQGRYSWSLATMTSYRVLGPSGPALMPAALILLLVGGWWYCIRVVIRPALPLALALTLAFVTGVPNLWQSVYWMNASLNYVLPLALGLWFAGWLWRRARWPERLS